MKIEVGDRVTYKDGYVGIVLDNEEINYQTVVRDREIIKVERIGQNGWEVIEEKKELLTDEEREFLKLCLKFFEIEINSIELKEIQAQRKEIHFNKNRNGSGLGYWYYTKNEEFKGLELDKVYTLSELRIGGINNGSIRNKNEM